MVLFSWPRVAFHCEIIFLQEIKQTRPRILNFGDFNVSCCMHRYTFALYTFALGGEYSTTLRSYFSSRLFQMQMLPCLYVSLSFLCFVPITTNPPSLSNLVLNYKSVVSGRNLDFCFITTIHRT